MFNRRQFMKPSKQSDALGRRTVLRSAVATACAALFSFAVGNVVAAPVTLNIVDVAGNLALTQDAIENFQKKHPDLVSKVNFTKAPAPELPGKLKAMQAGGRSDIDMVLTGTDFLAAGVEQGVLIKLLPESRGEVSRPDRQLSAGSGEDAGTRARLRHHRDIHARGSAARVQPGQGQVAANHRCRTARMVQSQSEHA